MGEVISIDKLKNKNVKKGGIKMSQALIEKNTIDEKENRKKIAKIILFFINKTSTKLFRTKLHKLLFYSQFTYYKFYKKRLINEDFICNHYGPVLPNLDDYLNEFQDKGLIKKKSNQYGTYIISDYKTESLKFTDDELNILNQIAQKFDNSTSSEISKYSHEESLWKNTDLREKIPLEKAGELNDF